MTDDQHDQLPLAASPAAAQAEGTTAPAPGDAETDNTDSIGEPTVRTSQRRRRGSRGGRNRRKPAGPGGVALDGDDEDDQDADDQDGDDTFEPDEEASTAASAALDGQPELPKRMSEGRPSLAASEQALVRKPQIGDTRPAPPMPPSVATAKHTSQARSDRNRQDLQKSDRGKGERQPQQAAVDASANGDTATDAAKKKRRRGVKTQKPTTGAGTHDLDADTMERRRGRERNGRPIGRYLMAVQVRNSLTQAQASRGAT